MILQGKYVVGEIRGENFKRIKTAVIIPRTVNHIDLERLVVIPMSAGFFNISVDDKDTIIVSTYGRSETLNLDSVEEDNGMVRHALGLI